MPAIDLARLRKQANRLADFFFVPEDFLKYLREILDFYVNYSLRTKENIAPGSNLPTFRTPFVVTMKWLSATDEKSESNNKAIRILDFQF